MVLLRVNVGALFSPNNVLPANGNGLFSVFLFLFLSFVGVFVNSTPFAVPSSLKLPVGESSPPFPDNAGDICGSCDGDLLRMRGLYSPRR